MARQRDRVEGYIEKGKAERAKLATGGKRPAHLNRGYFIEPTVFANVDNNSTIAREEIFGPVLSVIPAENEANAVEIANDTIYGLNASCSPMTSSVRIRRPVNCGPEPSDTMGSERTSRLPLAGSNSPASAAKAARKDCCLSWR
jgi:hypothetical protein